MKIISSLAMIIALSASTTYGAASYTGNLDINQQKLQLAVAQLNNIKAEKEAFFEMTDDQFGSTDLYKKALKDEFGTIDSKEITLEAILNNVAYDVASLSEAEVQKIAFEKAKAHQLALDKIYKKYLSYIDGKSTGWFGKKYKTGLSVKKNNVSRMEYLSNLIKSKLGKDFSSSVSELEFQHNFINFVKTENAEIQKSKHESLLVAYENAFMNHKTIKNSEILNGFKPISTVLRNKNEFGGIILGKGKTIKVIIPGTKSLHDWAYNVDFTGDQGDALTGTGRGLNIHKGFKAAYSEARDIFVEKVQDYAKQHQVNVVEVSGHSLGAAIATILAYDFKDTVLTEAFVRLITFGSPRVVDTVSKEVIEGKLGLGNILRVANVYDPVTKVPAEFLNSDHVGTPILVEDSYTYVGALMDPAGISYHSMVRYYNKAKEAFEKIRNVAQQRLSLDDAYKVASSFYNDTYKVVMDEVNELAKTKFMKRKEKAEKNPYFTKEDLRERAEVKAQLAQEILDDEYSSDEEVDAAEVMIKEAKKHKNNALFQSVYFGHASNVKKIEGDNSTKKRQEKRNALKQQAAAIASN
jgi:hypothetical protein